MQSTTTTTTEPNNIEPSFDKKRKTVPVKKKSIGEKGKSQKTKKKAADSTSSKLKKLTPKTSTTETSTLGQVVINIHTQPGPQ